MALAVKVYLHRLAGTGLRPIVHRLRLAEPYVYSYLKQSVEKIAGGATVDNLRWCDDEKDLVTLKDDEDLRLASDFVKEQGQSLLRVHADVDIPAIERYRPAGDFVTEDAESSNHDEAAVPEEEVKEEKKGERRATWPVRDLTGGGKYSGYIRTTGADGKTIERELTVDEAADLLHPQLAGRHYGHSFIFPTYRSAFHHPLGLPFYL